MFKTHVLFTRTLLCRSRTWCLWHFPKCNFQFQSAPTSRYFIFNSFFLNFDFQTSPNIFWKTLPVQSVQAPHVLPSFRNWHSNSSLKLRVVHTYSWKRWQHLTERFTTFFKRRSYQSMLDGWCFVSFVKWNRQRTSRYIFLGLLTSPDGSAFAASTTVLFDFLEPQKIEKTLYWTAFLSRTCIFLLALSDLLLSGSFLNLFFKFLLLWCFSSPIMFEQDSDEPGCICQ